MKLLEVLEGKKNYWITDKGELVYKQGKYHYQYIEDKFGVDMAVSDVYKYAFKLGWIKIYLNTTDYKVVMAFGKEVTKQALRTAFNEIKSSSAWSLEFTMSADSKIYKTMMIDDFIKQKDKFLNKKFDKMGGF